MSLIQTYVFHGLLVCLLQETIAAKRSDNDAGLAKWNKDYYPVGREVKHLDLILSCKKKYQIVDIEVVAGNYLFDPDVTVYGTTPRLHHAVKQCYWNRGCTITFPADKMVMCVTIHNSKDGKDAVVIPYEEYSNSTCFLKDVKFLRPVHGKCVRAKLVKSICVLKTGKRVCPATLPKRKGLIKSHDLFPQYYNTAYQNLTWKCNFTLPNRKSKALLIGLKSVHVCDDDRLVLRTNKGEINIAEMEENKHLDFTKEDAFVELEFSVSSDSRGCEGFLICYNEVRKNKLKKYDGKKRSVCDDLFNKRKIPTIET